MLKAAVAQKEQRQAPAIWRSALLGRNLRSAKGGHDVVREAAQLVLEFRGREAFGPVDHEVLQAGILGFDRSDAINDVGRRATEPGLLLHAVTDRGNRRRRTRRAPRAALIVGIAHEAERREPLVALVMRGLDALDRLFLAAGQIQAGAPDHILAKLLGSTVPG